MNLTLRKNTVVVRLTSNQSTFSINANIMQDVK